VEVEALVVSARQAHPAWGGRKLKRWLENQGYEDVPAPSTITAILRRRGLLDPAESRKHPAYQRFEMDAPHQVWQMDFKGYFRMGNGQLCHPLTVLDDYARFLVGLRAGPDQTRETVQQHLTEIFQTCALPQRMLMDNGAPWGDDAHTPYTRLTAWVLRLGIAVSHGRPYHPQTQGKDERLHRTLSEELLARLFLQDLVVSPLAFDTWRDVYHFERPHEALDLAPPVTRFQPTPRPFPATLPPLVYPADMLVRHVDSNGRISLYNRSLRIGKTFQGYPVGLLPDPLVDAVFQVFFNTFPVRTLDLRRA
jgi:transposase InsO family protein